jgi:hypothetical protein
MSDDRFFAIKTAEQPWEERFNEKLGKTMFRKELHMALLPTEWATLGHSSVGNLYKRIF